MNQTNISTQAKNPPVFIHSLFRVGSTYLFNAFRRSETGYWCYQEPLHELVLLSQGCKEKLLEIHEKTVSSLRHPHLNRPYFLELYEVADSCLEHLEKEHIYDAYFPSEQKDSGASFCECLIAAAKTRPVIQECRTSMRIQLLKKRLGGTHLYLWRNPWDQWWSYKVDNYFDIKTQLFINGINSPEIIARLRREIAFSEFHSDDLQSEFAWFNGHRLAPEKNYMVFYTLWLLALQHGKTNADILINIDHLSCDTHYRQHILASLEEQGIVGINFDDCHIPQTCYGPNDKRFFQKIEDRVHGLFLCAGTTQEELNDLLHLRHSYEPGIWTDQDADTEASERIRDAERARAIVRNVEGREVSTQKDTRMNIEEVIRSSEAQIQKSEARATEAETRATESEAHAIQAETLARQAEARAAEEKRSRQEIKANLEAVYQSRSWRITAPLRWASTGLPWMGQGTLAWLTLKPGSRPRRVAQQMMVHLKLYIIAHPRLFSLARRCLVPFPRLKACLRSISQQPLPGSFSPPSTTIPGLAQLTPRARQIYLDLKTAFEQQHHEGRN